MSRPRRTRQPGEAPPRLDQIAGWPAPEEQAEWLGESSAERALLDAYRSGRMHHAWLIGGPKGIGKATLAYRFARFILAHPDPAAAEVASADGLSVAPDQPAFRKVAARAHPNLLVLERGYNDERKRHYSELTVDQIRRTVSFFGSTGGEAGWRVAIVDPADDMNASAANALLKILEEPPNRALFLIVGHAPGRLLPTIRSRCRRLELRPLAAETIIAALGQGEAESAAEGEELRLAGELAEGSLRRAIHLVGEGGLDLYRDLARLLARVPELDVEALHRLAERVSGRDSDDAFDGFLEALRGWLARRVRGVAEPDAEAAISPAARAAPLERWAEVWENVRRSSELADALNLDRKQAALSMLMDLARATRM